MYPCCSGVPRSPSPGTPACRVVGPDARRVREFEPATLVERVIAGSAQTAATP